MARPVHTLSAAQQRLDKKFPEKGLKLLKYSGSRKPCVILCPTHGKVHVSLFGTLLSYRHGCPKCGREALKASLVENSHTRNRKVANLSKATWSLSRRLTNLPIESMTDEQLGKEARALLLQYKSQFKSQFKSQPKD